MYCKICRCNPCKCSCSQPEAVCLVPAKPCVPGTPGIPGHPDIDYPLTLEKLLLLLKKKCDKTMCKAIQTEIDLLYALLGVDKPLPPGTLPPGGGVNPPVLPAFQLIANMVSNLNGDLTDKYPSAELLKAELMAIWKCMSHKQQHHGDWVDNWTYRTVIQSTNGCLIDGDKDPAPDKIKVITPVDVGSTVFAVIEGKKCLFESLVDNNITEPSKKSVLEGKWINYCDLKEVIDCVLPRKLITDCHALCDDPNSDGVHEDKTLCARVSCIEDQICNTDCVPGVPTICERLETLKAAEDHVTKFEFVNNPGSALDKYKITMKKGGTFQVPVVSVKTFELVGGDTYKITMTDGTVFTAACCQVANDGLPAGAITFNDGIYGSFSIRADKTPFELRTDSQGGNYHDIPFNCSEKTFKVSDYPYLGIAGRKIVMTMAASIGYYMKCPSTADQKYSIGPYQWDTKVWANGTLIKPVRDGYGLNRTGFNSGMANTSSFTFTTTGHDLVIKACHVFIADTNSMFVASDTLEVDVGASTISFSASDH